ncbi:alpha/beta hydrolase [Sphingomonas sp. CFBP 8760]|uniref:alpha/beta hydrolase n=1 Tax=Sphingomonas sp. CFBP 8760 TaxID=2775282 RepID=UPI00177CF95B|nr:alpha/beta hydrolase [Sphingomonas sp. CFBP 8760]MBD8548681.1 alpha/beta hydrolase [Sphingomonas sp. CFBP 8760]
MIAAILLALAVPLADTAPLTQHGVERPDGSRITYWLGETRHRSSGVVLVMQGTGCEAVSSKPNLRHAAGILRPGDRALLIDKVGVGSDDGTPVVDGCSQRYWDQYTLSLRVQDCLRVIADLRRQSWWNRRIVIFGGSEGGAVAALLAPLVPEAKAVIVLSSGTGVPVGELIRAAVPPAMAAEAPAVFAAAHERPTGQGRWGGLSYRWWDDAVDIVPARSLVQSTVPVLLIHGARDQSSPVSTARAGYEMARNAGKTNVEYRELAELDHFMRTADGTNHMDQVLDDAATWIEARKQPRRLAGRF